MLMNSARERSAIVYVTCRESRLGNCGRWVSTVVTSVSRNARIDLWGVAV